MDGSALRRAADLVEDQATAVRRHAQLLAAHRDAMRWHSPAARACRDRLDSASARMAAWSAAADDLAALLRTQSRLAAAAP